MDDRAFVGPDFRGLNPLILGEVARNGEVLICDRALRGYFVVPSDIDHLVGLADAPTGLEMREGGRLLRVALGRAAVCPRGDGLNVAVAETAFIAARAVVR